MMKAPLLAWIATFVLFAVAAASANTEAPAFPRELKLSSGAVLKNVTVVRWEKDRVVVKHQGGTDPVFYRHIAEPDRSRVLAVQANAEKEAIRRKSAVAEEEKKERVYRGQVFVATLGGENVKLGSVRVRAFPIESLAKFEHTHSQVIELPAPFATTVTDAEGRFTLTVPGTAPFFIMAQSGRHLGRRNRSYIGDTEIYDWRIPASEIKDPDNVLLNNRNLAKSYTVKIAGEE